MRLCSIGDLTMSWGRGTPPLFVRLLWYEPESRSSRMPRIALPFCTPAKPNSLVTDNRFSQDLPQSGHGLQERIALHRFLDIPHDRAGSDDCCAIRAGAIHPAQSGINHACLYPIRHRSDPHSQDARLSRSQLNDAPLTPRLAVVMK